MSDIGIAFSESALSDLQGILEWYADKGIPEVGDRFVFEIFERAEALALPPDIGRVVPEFGKSFLRELIHPPFRIVSRRDAKRVFLAWPRGIRPPFASSLAETQSGSAWSASAASHDCCGYRRMKRNPVRDPELHRS